MGAGEVGRIAAAIRTMIDTGRFLPGEQLWAGELAGPLGVERRVVDAALGELGEAGVTRWRPGYWVAARRHPRMRGLSRMLGYWLWNDEDGRTFVSTTRTGLVVVKLADEDTHVADDRVRIVANAPAPETLRAIRRGHLRMVAWAAREARGRAGATWWGDVEVVRAPVDAPALTWLGDTSQPGLLYASWRHGASVGELIIGSLVTEVAGEDPDAAALVEDRREIALWPSVDGEPEGSPRLVTGLDEMATLRLVRELSIGTYLSIERLLGQLGTSKLTGLSRGDVTH